MLSTGLCRWAVWQVTSVKVANQGCQFPYLKICDSLAFFGKVAEGCQRIPRFVLGKLASLTCLQWTGASLSSGASIHHQLLPSLMLRTPSLELAFFR